MNIDLEYLDRLLGIMDNIIGPTDIMVTGGAIRDMLFDKEIKDIDIYYTGEIESIYAGYKVQATGIKYEGTTFQITHEISATSVPQLPVPVQLIKVEALEEAVKNFPSSLCRPSFYKTKGLYIPNDTLIWALDNYVDYDINKISSDHYKRMKAKYHDWKFTYVTKPSVIAEVPF
jgi:hypothetical protein